MVGTERCWRAIAREFPELFQGHQDMTTRLRLPLFLMACAASAFVAGCGESGPDIASVSGTVTMDGEPLANASVVFAGTSGRPAGGATDSEGKYVLNFSGGRQGAQPGKYKVRISTAADPWEDDDGTMMPATAETVPIRYNSDTELEFEVVEGQANVADFDLTSDGTVVGLEEDDQ